MAINGTLRFITMPLRAISKSTRNVARSKSARATSAMGSASTASVRAGGSVVAKSVTLEDLFQEEYQEERSSGLETIFFQQLPRPRLTERSASDLTLEQARQYSKEAGRFYNYDFSLFAGGEFFYEEVEENFLTQALGADEGSVDRRFTDVMTMFRRTLNANSCRLVLLWTPGLLLGSVLAGYAASNAGIGSSTIGAAGADGEALREAATLALAVSVGLVLLLVMLSWPYKVVQQRNLMNLDNYITSKFARINNNFQVAKRRALNVERDKRMNQREELKEEAGVWTLAYQWFAMRLFLCELLIRNKFYQVRRNTALYWAGGLGLTMVALAAALALEYFSGASMLVLTVSATAGAVYILLAGAMLRKVAPMMFQIVQANEWSRFHLVHLHQTVADHVGEDKVQIVTFRDRNRFE